MSRYFRRGLIEYLTIRTLPRPLKREISTLSRQKVFTGRVSATTPTIGHSIKLLTSVRQFATRTDNLKTTRQNLWKILRILFLVTGGVVWGLPAIVYVGYKTGLLKVEVEEDNESETNHSLDDRIFSIFDVSKDDEHDTRAREIGEKSSALMKIWNQLKLEEGIVRKFGDPVDLIGYRGNSWIEYIDKHNIFSLEQHDSNNHNTQDLEILMEKKMDEKKKRNGILEWCVACVVAGPKLTGILELQFSKVNAEWVPVSLRLEGLQKTGEVICDISGPLPNGVTRFTRLSND